MRLTLSFLGPALVLTLAGLAFTAAVCLLTAAIVGIAWVLFGAWADTEVPSVPPSGE